MDDLIHREFSFTVLCVTPASGLLCAILIFASVPAPTYSVLSLALLCRKCQLLKSQSPDIYQCHEDT